MRFFIDDPQSALPIEVLRHLRVLRLRAGERFTLCDGHRGDYICAVTAPFRNESDSFRFEIIEKRECLSEPGYDLSVFLAFSKPDRLETAVQKCTELGANRFILFPSQFSGPAHSAKLTRLQAVARSAAEQSGRGIIPEVSAVSGMNEAVKLAAAAELPLFPYEREQNTTVLSAFEALQKSPQNISVLTGSEGGFSESEAIMAEKAGLISVTLGKRILRCETAPIAVASFVSMYV